MRREIVLSEKDHLSWECKESSWDGSTQPHEWVPWNQTPSCVTLSPGTCHRIRRPLEDSRAPSLTWHQHNSSYYFGFYRYDVMYSSQQPMWIKIAPFYTWRNGGWEVKPFPRVYSQDSNPGNWTPKPLLFLLNSPSPTDILGDFYKICKEIIDFVAHSPHPTRIQTP